MLNGIMPIRDLTNLVAIMQLDEDDKNMLIDQLNRYAQVASDALEAIGSNNEILIENIEETNAKDDPDQALSDSEEEAWVGLTAMNGYTEDPRPEWYIEMWKDGKNRE